MKYLLILLIKIYQKFLSPLCPGVCRFRPTCSAYFIEALKIHGFVKGTCGGFCAAIPGAVRDMIRFHRKSPKRLIIQDKGLLMAANYTKYKQ